MQQHQKEVNLLFMKKKLVNWITMQTCFMKFTCRIIVCSTVTVKIVESVMLEGVITRKCYN